jgi:hypothetical protein
MSIDEFGREVHTEEPIPMFGGVIRRMPTISSVGSRERELAASLRSGTRLTAQLAAHRQSRRRLLPPHARRHAGTMVSFNDAASNSLASASASLKPQ